MGEPVIVTTPEQLRAIVAAAVADAMRKLGGHVDDWMTADECAALLDVARTTLPSLVSRESLPCYRPGKGYTFRRSEVEAWLLERRNRPGARTRGRRGTLTPLPGGERR
jgi:excisionase family DNA binding protein